MFSITSLFPSIFEPQFNGPTAYFAFPCATTWLLFEFKYQRGQLRLTADMYRTDENLENVDENRLKQLCETA